MEKIKNSIELTLNNTVKENERLYSSLTDSVSLDAYEPKGEIWTNALQSALNEHQIVYIPKRENPYIIDNSIVVPSNRRIVADNEARIKLLDGVSVLMLRNQDTADGTHMPIIAKRSENISIEGGIWEDWCPHRMGYGKSGKYDTCRSFFGVSTYMLLENINHLTLKNMTFKGCGGFAIQIGEAKDVVIENITFDTCYADGVHVNGNVENIYISNVKGYVGDDLVAFNMFDWQDSSINFGPCKNVICQDLDLYPNSHYKALRIEPGVYTFKDGKRVDCSLENAIFRRIFGIKTYKLYCQTPPYKIGQSPEPVSVGSGNNIFFEDIKIDLDAPIDLLKEYIESDPIKGSIAGFELGLNVKNIYFKNIDITLHRDKYPYSYLLCIGPKSSRFDDGTEVFDPYFSSVAQNVYLENITVNGKCPKDIYPYIREIVFDNLYDDISSTGCGKIENIIYS